MRRSGAAPGGGRMARRFLAFLAGLFLCGGPACATVAHPAMWHIQGPAGDVTLFGSIHLLPADLDWQRPSIRQAIDRADVFVFETPTDATAVARLLPEPFVLLATAW